MKSVLELLLFFGIVVLFAGISIYAYIREKPPSSPDKCNHRRWTKWKIEQVQPIHIYSEVDEGRGLPDRVDAYMTRQCVACGLPQAKTVRGIDSSNYK